MKISLDLNVELRFEYMNSFKPSKLADSFHSYYLLHLHKLNACEAG